MGPCGFRKGRRRASVRPAGWTGSLRVLWRTVLLANFEALHTDYVLLRRKSRTPPDQQLASHLP